MTKDGKVRLPDGRWLGYAEYGDPNGKPVFCFHGAPNSRLLHGPEEPTREMGVRLIVVERPGFGLSDFQENRKLLDWPTDVCSLADALGIDRFPVMGFSAGGPYAAACAFRIPERVPRISIICGVGPTDVPGALEEMPAIRRLGAMIARKAPWLLRGILWLTADPKRDPEGFFRKMLRGNSPFDRELLSRPEMKEMMIAHFKEATRSGMRGFAQDAVILSNPWGFRLEEIRGPVFLWHGEGDTNVSLSAARHVARTIPGCQATFLPGEGHWLFIGHWREILLQVVT